MCVLPGNIGRLTAPSWTGAARNMAAPFPCGWTAAGPLCRPHPKCFSMGAGRSLVSGRFATHDGSRHRDRRDRRAGCRQRKGRSRAAGAKSSLLVEERTNSNRPKRRADTPGNATAYQAKPRPHWSPSLSKKQGHSCHHGVIPAGQAPRLISRVIGGSMRPGLRASSISRSSAAAKNRGGRKAG